jgi:hypothetical protein
MNMNSMHMLKPLGLCLVHPCLPLPASADCCSSLWLLVRVHGASRPCCVSCVVLCSS